MSSSSDASYVLLVPVYRWEKLGTWMKIRLQNATDSEDLKISLSESKTELSKVTFSILSNCLVPVVYN